MHHQRTTALATNRNPMVLPMTATREYLDAEHIDVGSDRYPFVMADEMGANVFHGVSGWYWSRLVDQITRPTDHPGHHFGGPFPSALDAARDAVRRLSH